MKNLSHLLFLLIQTLNLFSDKALSSKTNSTILKDSIIYNYKLTKTIQCEGLYPMHLQGISTDKKNNIFWSFTNELVRTDLNGKVLDRIKVLNHHGDLCYEGGKVYVAVNLGKFNELPGQEDSWVFVYDVRGLKELARYKVLQLVHGAGGISVFKGKFFLVGGLPKGFNENYIYEYDQYFTFTKRHLIASGYTYKGIQTAEFIGGKWWFGCYGNPKLITTDENFKILDKNNFDASLGTAEFTARKLFIANSKPNVDKLHQGTIGVYER